MLSLNTELFSFFSKLKQNNNREWFQANKAEFKILEGEVKLFMKEIEQRLQIHDKIEKAHNYREAVGVWVRGWPSVLARCLSRTGKCNANPCSLPVTARCRA